MQRFVDLAGRWRRARHDALLAVFAEHPASKPELAGDPGDEALLRRALALDVDLALRKVFDNSRRLGEGFRRFYGRSLELPELPMALGILGQTDAACLAGSFTTADDEPALELTRDGCQWADHGAPACNWWREAINGLILGLTGDLRHARHASRGHGDPCCVDAIHADPESRRRFGPIPDDLRQGLADVARMVVSFDSTARVEFLGVSEGVLYYQLPASCGVDRSRIRPQPLLERGVQRRFPQLALREVTPRSVLTES